MTDIDRDRVIRTLFRAIDAVNPELPRGRKLPRSADAVLLGESSGLDSLGLVSFIVATEQMVQEDFQVPVALLDEALSQGDTPFRTVGSLADHVHSLLEKAR